MKHVCYFRHALALDERRVKFLPEYAYGGSATSPTVPEDMKFSPVDQEFTHHNDNTPSTGNKDDSSIVKEPSDDRPPAENETVVNRLQARTESTTKPPHTIEVWFAGTHSDMYVRSLFQPEG
jgi:hypothetical protein